MAQGVDETPSIDGVAKNLVHQICEDDQSFVETVERVNPSASTSN